MKYYITLWWCRPVCSSSPQPAATTFALPSVFIYSSMVVQACLFYIPRAIWLSVEGGLMKHLAKDKQGILVEDAEAKTSRLLADFSQHLHNKYNK